MLSKSTETFLTSDLDTIISPFFLWGKFHKKEMKISNQVCHILSSRICIILVTRKKNTHSKTSKNLTTKNPPQKEVIEHGKGNGHSDSIALTAAVFFGLAFMFVTIYLVGRRWLEGIRDSKSRRNYTRISFLLNGDDRT